MAFYDMFEKLCNKSDVTPTQVAREIGISQSVVSMWKKRGSTPRGETLQRLADYFGVSVSLLLELQTIDLELTQMEDELKAIKKEENRLKIQGIKKKNEAIQALFEMLGIEPEDPPMMEAYHLLNSTGKKIAVERVRELGKIPEYQAPSVPPSLDPIPDTPEPQEAAEGGSEPKKDNGTKGPVATCGDDSPN